MSIIAIYSYHPSNTSYDLDEAIEHAHTYLNKQILSDGKFIYRKYIDPHKYLEPEYNILRHMGSIYSLILMNDYKQGSMDIEKVGNSIQFIKDNSFEKVKYLRQSRRLGFVNRSKRVNNCATKGWRSGTLSIQI